jgi:hypothetical protein
VASTSLRRRLRHAPHRDGQRTGLRAQTRLRRPAVQYYDAAMENGYSIVVYAWPRDTDAADD